MILFVAGLFLVAPASANVLGLKEGDDCTALDGGRGTCRLLSKCETAGDFKERNPPICRFVGIDLEPIVCCPAKKVPIPKKKPGTKAQLVCSRLLLDCLSGKSDSPKDDITVLFKPAEKLSDCKAIVQPALGGVPVPAKGHPYMALIGFCGEEKWGCDISEINWGCGGTLISPKFVLSAAHCANPQSLGAARWARLGDLDIGTSEDDAKPVDKRIVELFIHPKYSPAQVYHDIALFKLDSDVKFSDYILPVCLQYDTYIFEKKANFTGWGRTGFVDATSEKLLEAEIDIYNDTECRRLMFSENTPKTPLGLQPDLMLCAGVPDGSKDACSGDSGGPLVTRGQYSCIKTQIGITSFGNNCGLPDSPGVYTRVSNYIGWIEDVAFQDVAVC